MPIVEPEVLMDGNHTIERCEAVMQGTLQAVFAALYAHRVLWEGMLLKTGMVLPGQDCPQQADGETVAAATLRCLRRAVPPAVPGIVFLSGGQTDIAATERLNAIGRSGDLPWKLTFSYGRALQDEALKNMEGFACEPGSGTGGAASSLPVQQPRYFGSLFRRSGANAAGLNAHLGRLPICLRRR